MAEVLCAFCPLALREFRGKDFTLWFLILFSKIDFFYNKQILRKPSRGLSQVDVGWRSERKT